MQLFYKLGRKTTLPFKLMAVDISPLSLYDDMIWLHVA
jgi:hypothetical protein